ncbi:hypothetical protein [Pseudonocardia sp. NPDC049154]|uniref:hypothetical protein n=1 Tax=Pseudonocardia sp. NPDC049154 TaxID=3155501 RepID=UPI003408F29F
MTIADTLAVPTTQDQDLRSHDCDDALQDVEASSGLRLVARWSGDTRPTASWYVERRRP